MIWADAVGLWLHVARSNYHAPVSDLVSTFLGGTSSGTGYKVGRYHLIDCVLSGNRLGRHLRSLAF